MNNQNYISVNVFFLLSSKVQLTPSMHDASLKVYVILFVSIFLAQLSEYELMQRSASEDFNCARMKLFHPVDVVPGQKVCVDVLLLRRCVWMWCGCAPGSEGVCGCAPAQKVCVDVHLLRRCVWMCTW